MLTVYRSDASLNVISIRESVCQILKVSFRRLLMSSETCINLKTSDSKLTVPVTNSKKNI
ncbi:hypothetical protein T01_9783 [Trichinella spiralis]|uniref:Uncharacterized protein n=1 Tax=Trichinella spiralis TaxID=6334 RepID=A0A0V1BU30_TRISP|nr:hypothetical protein T01_9783 [Trichinella spiralis]